jgi:hypothetical protein
MASNTAPQITDDRLASTIEKTPRPHEEDRDTGCDHQHSNGRLDGDLQDFDPGLSSGLEKTNGCSAQQA